MVALKWLLIAVHYTVSHTIMSLLINTHRHIHFDIHMYTNIIHISLTQSTKSDCRIVRTARKSTTDTGIN